MADLQTILYWIIGIAIVVTIIDTFLLKPIQDKGTTEQLIETIKQIQKMPTINPGISPSSRGILIGIVDSDNDNDNSFKQAIITTNVLRKIGCNLPITIALSGETQHESIPQLGLNVIKVPSSGLKGLLYAIVHCKYTELIIIDPTILFIQLPEILFQDQMYQQSGALYWKDIQRNTIWDKKAYTWVRKLVNYRRSDNDILNQTSGNFQSGDIIVLNKAKHVKTLQILQVFADNIKIVMDNLSGPKELFWISAELAQTDYAFCDHRPGVIGQHTWNSLCGALVYTYHDASPLAIRRRPNEHMSDYKYYIPDNTDSQIEWLKGMNSHCCKVEPGVTLQEIPQELKHLLNEYTRIMQMS